jgi:hypothetical protein
VNETAQIIGLGKVLVKWQPQIPQFDPQFLVLAESLWKQRPPHLFNGSVLMHLQTQVQPGRVDLTGAFTDYRMYYAQKQSGRNFGLNPIAVSGLMICQGHLILGRRGAQVTAYPGWYEIAPAGGLDLSVAMDDRSIDYTAQLRAEFTEEIGLPEEVISDIRPFGVVYDPQDPVYDVVCEMSLTLGPAEVLAAMANSAEYTQALAIPLSELPAWLESHRAELIPPSAAILDVWRP